MKIELKDAKESRELILESSKIELLLYNSKLVISLNENELVSIEWLGQVCEYTEGQHDLPIILDEENKCEMMLKLDDHIIRYSFRLRNTQCISQETILNLMHFADSLDEYFKDNEYYYISELIDEIKKEYRLISCEQAYR